LVQKKQVVVLEKGSGTSSVEEEESTRTASDLIGSQDLDFGKLQALTSQYILLGKSITALA
jgi:hypothetical protein